MNEKYLEIVKYYDHGKKVKIRNKSQNFIFSMDTEDLPLLENYSWSIHSKHPGDYIRCSNYHQTGYHYSLHRLILQNELNKPENMNKEVDHIDNNKRNNCKDNLRIVTPIENCLNRNSTKKSKSKIPYVFKRDNKWVSLPPSFLLRNNDHSNGTFTNKYYAALASDHYIITHAPINIAKIITNYSRNLYPDYILKKFNIKNILDIPCMDKYRIIRGKNKYYGIYHNKDNKFMAWVADYNNPGKIICIGRYNTIDEAVNKREEYLRNNPLCKSKSNITYSKPIYK